MSYYLIICSCSSHAPILISPTIACKLFPLLSGFVAARVRGEEASCCRSAPLTRHSDGAGGNKNWVHVQKTSIVKYPDFVYQVHGGTQNHGGTSRKASLSSQNNSLGGIKIGFTFRKQASSNLLILCTKSTEELKTKESKFEFPKQSLTL